jgi:hypothetical protein
LGTVPYGADNDPARANAINNDVGSAADWQLAQTGTGPRASGEGEAPEYFGHSHDSCDQPLCGIWFIEGDEHTDLAQPCSGNGRPDDFYSGQRRLYRHSASSSWFLPHTHFGGGNS